MTDHSILGETMNLSAVYNNFNPAYALPVTIFGAGSVGSWTALFFAQKGVPNITVWDADEVASDNIPSSCYFQDGHIGRRKVEVLRELVFKKTGREIKVVDAFYRGQERLSGTIISAVDQMNTGRKLIWPRVKENPQVKLYCDSRTNALYAEVYAIDPYNAEDCTAYEATLFDDTDATRQMCGRHTDLLAAVTAAKVIVAKTCTWWTNRQKGGWLFAERCDTLSRVF